MTFTRWHHAVLALKYLKAALKEAKAAKSKKVAGRIRLALSSAEGGVRHAHRLDFQGGINHYSFDEVKGDSETLDEMQCLLSGVNDGSFDPIRQVELMLMYTGRDIPMERSRDGDEPMLDRDVLHEIQQLMDGKQWDSDTSTQIAELLRRSGRRVRDYDESADEEAPEPSPAPTEEKPWNNTDRAKRGRKIVEYLRELYEEDGIEEVVTDALADMKHGHPDLTIIGVAELAVLHHTEELKDAEKTNAEG